MKRILFLIFASLILVSCGGNPNERGIELYKAGKYQEALAEFEKARSTTSTDPEPGNNAGMCLLQLGQTDQAIAAFQESIKLKSLPMYHYNLGLAFAKANNQKEALKAFTGATSLDDSYFDAWFYQGAMEYALNDFSSALKSWNKAGSLKQSPEVETNLGVAYMEQKDLAKAAQHFGAALKLNPEHVMAHYNLGVLSQGRADYAKAIDSYKTAIQIDPTMALAHLNLGISYQETGKKHNARLAFRKFLEIAPREMVPEIAEANKRLAALTPEGCSSCAAKQQH